MQFTTILSVAFAAATALAAPQAAVKPTTTAATTLPTAVPEVFSYSCKCATAAGVPNKAITQSACATITKAKFTFAMNDVVGSCDARDATTKKLATGLSTTAFGAACKKLNANLSADCQ